MADQAEINRMVFSKDAKERRMAAEQLEVCFADLPDKNKAWLDLHHLISDNDINVRWQAADALGSAFSHVPDKNQAWLDIHGLASEKNYSSLRRSAAYVLGSAFSYIPKPNKNRAWDDLNRLTLDNDIYVKAQAYHSMGTISISRAANAENPNGFKEEMEKAIRYFNKASLENIHSNPANFCLPFYRSFYAIIIEEKDAQGKEISNYLEEARSTISKSSSKEILIEAIENLKNALKEAQKARNFHEKKIDLSAYNGYCERACKLLEAAEAKAPGAARALRRGIPKINMQITENIAEIQKNATVLCKHVMDTDLKEIGQQANKIGLELLKIRDPIGLEKGVDNLLIPLSAMCKKMPKEDKGEACEILKKINDEQYVEDKLSLINMFLSKISTQIHPKKEKDMKKTDNRKIIFGNGNIIGDGNMQDQSSKSPLEKNSKKPKKSALKKNSVEPVKAIENPKPPIPYLSELESEIADIFKSVYQKDRKAGVSEVNAKTLESLKHKLHDLNASGNDIYWLDMGCGDGRCLEVLDDIQNRRNIYYHGIDISHKFLDDAQMLAKKYGIRSRIETMNTAAMKFDSEFDLVSAVLFLHEVDPICLPYVIRNMLRALKSDGTLVISDFEGPYEQEEAVVSWGAKYLEKFLSNIGGARMSPGFVPSGEFPKELGFYRCYVKKPELDEDRFEKFIEGYGGFMKEKKEDSRKRREELRSQINKKVCEILKRPDVDTKNISDEEKALLRESMGKEYGIKALKIRLLTNEILFLDKRISEFEKGERCEGV